MSGNHRAGPQRRQASQSNKRRGMHRGRQAKLRFEPLEQRTMFAGGAWTQVTPLPNSGAFTRAPGTDGTGTMLLLSDGSVMVNGGGGFSSNEWFKLTADSKGNYSDGTWSTLASSALSRLFFGSVVLPDGRVLILGGEYTGPNDDNNESNLGEIYDPTTNVWSPITPIPTPSGQFGDGRSRGALRWNRACRLPGRFPNLPLQPGKRSIGARQQSLSRKHSLGHRCELA